MSIPWNHQRMSVLRYVGAKLRIAPRVVAALKATGADCLVDVFGGSGAVVMNAGFDKRVFNDADSELVRFFRVLADPRSCRQLQRRLRELPMSREIFAEMQRRRRDRGTTVSDVESAVATFYVSRYAFGGKIHTGGFAASLETASRVGPAKEIKATKRIVEELRAIGTWWRDTVIEHAHYSEIIRTYGHRPKTVLYCDPPYDGTERYYSHLFGRADHVFLAEQLAAVQAKVVLSYYETPLVAELYPERGGWTWQRVEATKNNMGREFGHAKEKVTELLITKN